MKFLISLLLLAQLLIFYKSVNAQQATNLNNSPCCMENSQYNIENSPYNMNSTNGVHDNSGNRIGYTPAKR